MWKSILKVMAATVVFGLVHSALASQKAKTSAVRLVGERRRNAWYRPAYLVQSLVTFGSLALYVKGLPNRTLYRVRGPLAGVMQLTRVASVGYAVYAAHHVGIPAMLGWPGLTAWWHGAAVVPREPEAQGPARSGGEGLHVAGPFLVSRHPLNLAPLPALWLAPTMTVNLAVLNSVATLYFVLGSVHEERRLRTSYGEAYSAYQHSAVPFYVPKYGNSRRLPSQRLDVS
jgi:protein-S-isoprenylcysteine O-methyltransferase Ste14